jgi:hypothetical protein
MTLFLLKMLMVLMMKLLMSMNLVVDILVVGSIHLQCDNDLLENDKLHFVAIEIQILKWKIHNENLIVWGLFLLSTTI